MRCFPLATYDITVEEALFVKILHQGAVLLFRFPFNQPKKVSSQWLYKVSFVVRHLVLAGELYRGVEAIDNSQSAHMV